MVGDRVIDERELLESVTAAAAALLLERLITPDDASARALGRMETALFNLAQFRLHGHEVSGVPARVKCCERCNAEFFFAELPTGRWIPLELDQVEAAEVLPAWRYIVNFDLSTPRVTQHPGKQTGKVWVNHIETCGAGDGPRHAVAPYVRRYRVNAERLDVGEVNDTIHKLQAQYRELTEGDADGI